MPSTSFYARKTVNEYLNSKCKTRGEKSDLINEVLEKHMLDELNNREKQKVVIEI